MKRNIEVGDTVKITDIHDSDLFAPYWKDIIGVPVTVTFIGEPIDNNSQVNGISKKLEKLGYVRLGVEPSFKINYFFFHAVKIKKVYDK